MKGSERARIAASPEITSTEAARRLGLTQQAVGQWATRLGAPVRADGRTMLIQWPAFARWREVELVKQAKAKAAPASLDDARARKANAEAELAEIEVAKARGEVVAIADYESAVGRILDVLAARLRALPVRLSNFGPEAEAAATAEAEQIVGELYAWDVDVIDEPESEEKAA